MQQKSPRITARALQGSFTYSGQYV